MSGKRPRELNTRGLVTDATAGKLLLAGWRPNAPPDHPAIYEVLWRDPKTGHDHTIMQAEAIRRDRLPPPYRFS